MEISLHFHSLLQSGLQLLIVLLQIAKILYAIRFLIIAQNHSNHTNYSENKLDTNNSLKDVKKLQIFIYITFTTLLQCDTLVILFQR